MHRSCGRPIMTVLSGELFARLSVELGRATNLATQIEATLEHSSFGRGPDLRSLQNLDLLTQTLADLVRFTHVLNSDLPVVLVDPSTALQQLTLRGVAACLGCSSGVSDDDWSEGDLAVF